MTDETTNGCITHKDRRHIRLYYDYLDIYKGNEHKAKIIRVLETWTDSKREAWYKFALEQKERGITLEEPEFWITMSYQQFRHFLRETVGVDTLKGNLGELLKAKHIERRVNPENPYGPPQYKLNCAAVQKAINKLPTAPFIPDIPPLEEITPPSEDTPPPGNFTPPPGVDIPPPQGGNLPPPQGGKPATSNNNDKITSNNNEEDSFGDSATATPPSPSEEIPAISEQTPSASPAAAPDFPLAPPSKPEPAALGNENETHSQLSTPGVDNSQGGGDTSPQQRMLVVPAASKQSARREKKPVEPKPEPTSEELALQARCKAWYDRLTEWCGGPMTKGGQVINEHRVIKLACQKYSDPQLEGIFTYLTTRDWKYSKIDNKYTVRGYVLWDEAGRVAQILREERRQGGQYSPPVSNAPRSAANMPANLGNEPLVVWKPPTKTKQPVTARGN